MPRRRSHVKVRRPVVWVVGASRGIGAEIARQFAMIGCRVCLSARTKKALNAVTREIEKVGGHAFSVPCDVTAPRTVTSAAEYIRKTIGEVDLLVNNAGVTVFKSFLQTSISELNDILATNLCGQILCTKAILPSMVRRRGGWIFNILSTAAVDTFEGSSAYTAAKAGMHGFSKVLREEMRRYNVKVVNVLPGPTETAMWSPSSRKKYSHRMMSATNVAEAVLALYQLPSDVVPEEVVLKPIKGDIG